MDDMKPRIVDLPEFTVVGLELVCQMSDVPKIPGLWEQFISRMGELAGMREVWGVCLPVAGDPHAFRYLACAAVADGTAAPAGMVAARVPAAKYAVFPFKGQPQQMSQVFNDIYSRRLAAAGLNADHSAPCLELYPEDCHDEATGEMQAELYVAVK